METPRAQHSDCVRGKDRREDVAGRYAGGYLVIFQADGGSDEQGDEVGQRALRGSMEGTR